jgi:uracil-DNA glycosylase family 4
MNTQFLRNYLAWQSEIGCDEVILPHPLVRKDKVAVAVEVAKKLEPAHQPAFQHADAFRPTSESNVFGDLARTLQSPVVPTKAIKLEVPVIAKQAPARVAEAIQYPTFTSIADFWDYLSKHAKTVFATETDISLLQGIGPVQAPLALVSMQPNEADCLAGQIFSGDAGILLEKMMKAIRLDCNLLYRTSVVKYNAVGRVWSRREIARILPLLHSELSLSQVPVVLLLGEACAQAVLKTTKTMEELRQIPHREGNRDFVVTYHPDDLLRRDEWKRKAWEDLQWLQRRLNQMQAQA